MMKNMQVQLNMKTIVVLASIICFVLVAVGTMNNGVPIGLALLAAAQLF